MYLKMISSKYPSIARRVIQRNSVSICFQGHYVNNCDSHRNQCHGLDQRRAFFNFPTANRTREYCGRQLVGYSMDQMFEVVADVGSYYKFLPWCKKSIVLSKTPVNLKADLIIGFPPINESYTSHVALVKPHIVRAECKDGRLFNHMLTIWRFSPGLEREQQSCIVDFQVRFEFRSVLHSHLSNLFFDEVARKMEGAFIKEVGKRYGPAAMQPRNLLINKHDTAKS